MLKLVQSLGPSRSHSFGELSSIASSIYRQSFAEIAKKHQSYQLCTENGNTLQNSFDTEPSNQPGNSIDPTDNDVWIFGYGSLVWKADFPYIDRRRGYICGYKRRFYQHSIDHRGIPKKPGRVVTLLPGEIDVDRVYGVAYRIADSQKANVLNHLDYREKNGYERFNVEFHEYSSTGNIPIQVIIYMASQANDSYAGDVWQVPCIAKQIFTSAGPSGSNRDYLFNLSIAMQQLFPDAVDEHLTELVASVHQLIEKEEPVLLERAITNEILSIFNKCFTCETPTQYQQITNQLETLRQNLERPGTREMLLHQEM